MEEAEGQIQHYKGRVNLHESRATGYEERLGPLKKEGKCRIRQCSCE